MARSLGNASLVSTQEQTAKAPCARSSRLAVKLSQAPQSQIGTTKWGQNKRKGQTLLDIAPFGRKMISRSRGRCSPVTEPEAGPRERNERAQVFQRSLPKEI